MAAACDKINLQTLSLTEHVDYDMPDFIDQMQDNDATTKILEANIAKARAAATMPVLSRKFCLNCGDPTTAGAAFCDTDCQEDYEKIQRMRGVR